MKKVINVFLLSLLFVCKSSAQIPQPSRTPPVDIESDSNILKISTTLIQLDVVVTDGKGNLVTDLKPEEFEVFENGKKQEITNFSYINVNPQNTSNGKVERSKTVVGSIPLPSVKLKPEEVRRTYALVVDDLGLSFTGIGLVKTSIKKFVNEQMLEGDLVAIICTGNGIGALQSFTSDKRQLLTAVDKIKWNTQGRSGIDAFPPIETSLKEDLDGRKTVGGATKTSVGMAEDYAFEKELNVLRNENFAVGTIGALRYIINGMRNLPGRKAMMLFSEGFPLTEPLNPRGNVSLRTTNGVGDLLRILADSANRSSVIIYTLDPRGLDVPGMALASDSIAANSSISARNSLINSRAKFKAWRKVNN